MEITVSNKITIENPTPVMLEYCKALTLPNPDFYKLQNMGKWTGNTPRDIVLYERVGDTLILPFGCIAGVRARLKGDTPVRLDFAPIRPFNYQSHINLYPYQETAADMAHTMRNGVVVMPCGAGKTQTGLELVSLVGGRALWLTHTQDLLNQSMARAKSVFGCSAESYGTITEGKVNIGKGLTFATVQTMAKIDLTDLKYAFDCVIVDECMPGDTKIATPYGYKLLKNLCNGDIITSYNRTTGKTENKKVINTFKSKAHDIVDVNLSNGEKITCTGNHPIFTQRGWVDAERLENNDYVLRMVRKRGRDRQYAQHKQAQGVRSGMVLLFKRLFGKRRTQKGCVDGGAQTKSIRAYEEDKRRVSYTNHGKNDKKQSYEKSRNKRKGIKAIKRNRASSKDKMWKRYGTYCATTNFDACACRKGRGICRVSHTNKDGQGKWVSYLLQGRHSNSGGNDRNRSRRCFALCGKQTRAGQEERSVFEWIRVDSIEVQKPTSDGTFEGVCGDGYVYNIEVEDNNNYFANDYLVHNCHKAVGSPTKVMQFYKVLSALSCRYKYGLTATPERSDGLEKSMLALLGGICVDVPKETVAHTTCPVKVQMVQTDYFPSMDIVLAGDGTLNYARLVDDMIHDDERFKVVMDIVNDIPHACPTLVLANRVEYLRDMCINYEKTGLCLSGTGNSKAAKAERKEALRKLNDGEIDCVFATYQLAKEGLDVPNLRYVVFATPEKDKTTVIQAAGRVGRRAEGKDYGTVIDFEDNFGMYHGWAKTRRKYYRQLDYEVME